MEAERAKRQEAGLAGAPQTSAPVTADTIRSALQQATGNESPEAFQSWLEVGDASGAEYSSCDGAYIHWVRGLCIALRTFQVLRLQEYQAQFVRAGLNTLRALRALASDAEASFVASLQLPLGPKKVRSHYQVLRG